MIKYIFILSFFLFQLPIYSSMGLADLVFFLLNIHYIVSRKIKLPKAKYKNVILIFFCWLLIEPFFVSEFDGAFFLNRILRLVNLFFGVLIIPSVLSRNKKDLFKAIKFLCIICGFFFILTMLEFIMLKLNFNFDIRLLNRDVLKITKKPYSIYSEPSILAIILVISNYIIFYAKNIFNRSKTFFNFIIFINIITVLLTFTFSGFIGLLSFLILTLPTRKIIYAISSILFLSLFIDANNSMINENVIQRFDKIINNEDNSANQRLIGSWTVPFLYMDNIVVGAGTGQEILFLDKLNLNGVDNFSQFTPKINNSLALIFLENGLIGLFIFVLLILSFYKINKFLPIIILYYTFVHGSYFSALIWCAVVIFITLSLIQKSDQRAQN
jgi:hypothetical protein